MLHSDFTMAVEFRCASWLAQGSGDEASSQLIPADNCTPGALLPSYVKEDVIDWLRRNNMAFVVVDEFLEEWPDDDTNGPVQPRRGPPPTFVSSHSLVDSSPSAHSPSSSSSSSSSLPAAETSTTTTAASPVATLGFRLASRLQGREPRDRQEEEEEEHLVRHDLHDADEDHRQGHRTQLQRRTGAAAMTHPHNSVAAATTPPRPQGVQAAKNEWRRQQGAVERKVRMVPIVERVTHPSVCYVRIHRRRGNDKLLTPTELDAWALRIRRLGRLLNGTRAHLFSFVLVRCSPTNLTYVRTTGQGRIYVMMNTNFEDQGIQNATNLARRLPDLGTPCAQRCELQHELLLTAEPSSVPDWQAMQEEDAQQAKRHFVSLLFAGATKAPKTKPDQPSTNDKEDLPSEGDSHSGRRHHGNDQGESVEREDAPDDVQIIGHRHRAKEQRTIDDLFSGSHAAANKRKRADDGQEGSDDEDEQPSGHDGSNNDNGVTITSRPPRTIASPAKAKTTTTKKQTQAKKAKKATENGQVSLQRFVTSSKPPSAHGGGSSDNTNNGR
jgi:uncharacterized protein YecE (DUF72 family)